MSIIQRPSAAPRESVQVELVSGRAAIREFIRFPLQIYQGDPLWAAPLEIERQEFIDPRRQPFYKHGAAAQFLARRRGRVVGRIMASDDPRYNEQHGCNIGSFGLFESIDDEGVAHELIDAASLWLASRGRDGLLGPIDYSTNYACGLLIDGFDTPPRVMMNHNPPYYAQLLESCGLVKAKDLYAWWFNDPFDMAAQWEERCRRLEARGLSVRSPKRREIHAAVMQVKEIYNEAWSDHWGSVRMTDAEFEYYAHLLGQIAIPELLLLAEADGRPVGFSMTLPDLNEALRPIGGRLTRWGLPIGYCRLMRGIKRVHTSRLVTLGILDGYRKRGVSELLILHTLAAAKRALGSADAELGWTLEDNRLINRTIEKVGGTRYKTYRIYEKPLD